MPERIPSGILQDLYDYWQNIPKTQDLPDRSNIDPGAIPAILPNLFLLDVVGGGERFRMRLVGTYITEVLGFNPTGKFIDEIIQGDYLDYMNELFMRPIVSRQAVFSHSDFKVPEKNYLLVNRLLLPLTHGGTEVKILLVGQTFGDEDDLQDEAYHAVLRHPRAGEAEYSMQSFQIGR